jgi:hypothetical protein
VSERSIARFMLAAFACLATAPVAGAGEPAITDPTIPPGVDSAVSEVVAGTPLRLSSTRVSAASRSAIVNDRVVTPGSRVGGATVVSIEPGRVTLQRGTELITLRMPAPQVKRPANGDKP